MFDHPSLPLDELPAPLRWILKQAEHNYRIARVLTSSLYAESPTGEMKEVNSPHLLRDKDMTSQIMTMIAAMGFKNITFVTEAWMLDVPKEHHQEFIEVARRGEIYKHAERIEVIQVSYNTPTGDIFAALPIDNGNIIGPWWAMSNDPMPPNLPEHLKPRFNSIFQQGEEIRHRPGFEGAKDRLWQMIFG